MYRSICVSLVLVCGSLAFGGPPQDASQALRDTYPGVQFFADGGQPAQVYGATFSYGISVETSAAEFVRVSSGLFGVPAEELQPGNAFDSQYTPGSSGSATFSLCGTGTTYDSVLSVHTGCPGTSSNQIGCDDDACGTSGGPSTVTASVTAGTTYRIRVSGYSSRTGAYSLTITGPACGGGTTYTLTTAVSPAGAGTVTLNPTGGTYSSGTVVTVTANAASGYVLDHWSGDLSGSTNPTTITMNANKSVTAVFVATGGQTVKYQWLMDTSPGWTKSPSTTANKWAWGTATGGGGQHGSHDPTSGHTGTKVYGYNLTGDYANSIPEHSLTTTAINCSGLTQCKLRFWRWLGVEQPTYDHAYVRVSNHGSTWTTVWQNTAEVADGAWAQVEYDISAAADNKATVYIRWTMGATDSSWQYCGWNLDDVQIVATGP